MIKNSATVGHGLIHVELLVEPAVVRRSPSSTAVVAELVAAGAGHMITSLPFLHDHPAIWAFSTSRNRYLYR